MEKESEDGLVRTWSTYTRAALAEAYRGQGKYAESVGQFKQAVGLMEQRGAATYQALGQALENYASTLTSLGRDSESVPIRVHAKEIRDAQRKQYEVEAKVGMLLSIPCSERRDLTMNATP